jgi:hypothetical protein
MAGANTKPLNTKNKSTPVNANAIGPMGQPSAPPQWAHSTISAAKPRQASITHSTWHLSETKGHLVKQANQASAGTGYK